MSLFVKKFLGREKPRPHYAIIAMVVLGVMYLIFNIATILVYPPAESDEGHYSSQAFNFLTRGNFGFNAHFHSKLSGVTENYVPSGRLNLVALAFVFHLMGVSLFTARLLSLFAGVMAVYWTYRLGKELFGQSVGVVAAIVLTVSQPMFFSSHYGRPDVWLGAVVPFVAYWIVYKQKRQAGIGIWSTGLMTALLLDFHPNGAYFVVGFFLAWIVQGFGESGFLKLFSRYCLGIALGGIYWILAHFLPDPLVAWKQCVELTEAGLTPGSTGLLNNVSNQFEMWWRLYVKSRSGLGIIELAFCLLGFGYAIRRRNQSDRFLLLVIAGAMVSFAFFSVQKVSHYRIAWEPLVAVLISRAVIGLGEVLEHRLPSYNRLFITAALVAPLIVASIGANMYLVHRYRNYSYASEVKKLQSWVLPNAIVVGPLKYWYGFRKKNYVVSDMSRVAFSGTSLKFKAETSDEDKPYLKEFVSALRKEGIKKLSIIDWSGQPNSNIPAMEIGYLRLFEKQHCRIRGTLNSYSSTLPRPVSVYWCTVNDK